jgi:hypothetical protein
LVTDMKIDIEAARALLYETSYHCDLENNNLRVLEYCKDIDKEEAKRRKQLSRSLGRINGILTPMSKYYCSEMAVRVTNQAIQVLGGSGYMKDYPAERFVRDARITTIYEGTSQLQVVAAIRGITSGTFDTYLQKFEQKEYADPLLAAMKQKLADAKTRLTEAVLFAKQTGPAYVDLMGRRLVDGAIALIIGHLFLGQAAVNDRKKKVAQRYIDRELPLLRAGCEVVLAGDATPVNDYDEIAGPVPSTA